MNVIPNTSTLALLHIDPEVLKAAKVDNVPLQFDVIPIIGWRVDERFMSEDWRPAPVPPVPIPKSWNFTLVDTKTGKVFRAGTETFLSVAEYVEQEYGFTGQLWPHAELPYWGQRPSHDPRKVGTATTDDLAPPPTQSVA